MIFDFSAIMVFLVAISGLIWAVDAMLFAPKRRASAIAANPSVEVAPTQARESEPQLPVIVEYAKSFFPIFLVVLILRSFIIEPFRIPSGSMMPTLLVGDFILVDKNVYGIRLPLVNRKIIERADPERGDVVVFRYPNDPSTPFIKRVVGVPGDKIVYKDKTLYVNDKEMPQQDTSTYVGQGTAAAHTGAKLSTEILNGEPHKILTTPGARGVDYEGVVPADNYFVLGDNRDNSRDSRYWGFVPDENLVGRAFAIWMNWDGGPVFERIGTKIK